jgi:hypothetical protein
MLPEYWSQLLYGCVDFSNIHHGRPAFLRHLDYLLSNVSGRIETYSLSQNSDYFSAYCEFETIASFSPELVMKHQGCYLLGIASPLDFVLHLIQDILATYEHWRGEQLEIFSQHFQRLLKSTLLTLLPMKLKLNQELSTAFHPQTENQNNVLDEKSTMRNLSIDLLRGEEICPDASTTTQPSMTVWCSYVDAELLGSNQLQARKVLPPLLLTLLTVRIGSRDVTQLLRILRSSNLQQIAGGRSNDARSHPELCHLPRDPFAI